MEAKGAHFSGHVGSIPNANQCGSIKVKFLTFSPRTQEHFEKKHPIVLGKSEPLWLL